MSETIRFYMDEHFPGPITQALCRRGVDVLSTQEANHCGLSDVGQLAFARSQSRVMVTFDTDYLALHRTEPSTQASLGVLSRNTRLEN